MFINKQYAFSAARTGHDSLAIAVYRKVIAQNPTDFSNYANLAAVYQKKENYPEVVGILEKGDSIPDVLKNLGISYFFEKREKEGLVLLEKCLLINPDDPIVALYVGLCFKELNQLNESIDYLNFAAKIAIIKYYDAYLKAEKEDNAYHRKLTDYALARKRKFDEQLIFDVKKLQAKP